MLFEGSNRRFYQVAADWKSQTITTLALNVRIFAVVLYRL
jgi:hypothetical protein